MYKVVFIDGSEFQGGEPNCSLWDQIPNKPIKSLTCWLNENLKFQFTNFEELCSCVERVQIFNKSTQKSQEMVTKWIIMGRVGQRVYQVVYDLKRGEVYQLIAPWGAEYSNTERIGKDGAFLDWEGGKPISGWLQGILEAYPGPKLRKIE